MGGLFLSLAATNELLYYNSGRLTLWPHLDKSLSVDCFGLFLAAKNNSYVR